MATSSAPRACFVLLSASRSFRVGTRRTCHDTVDVLTSESSTTALGSAFATREHINARAWESVRACDEMRSATDSVEHAHTEMVLTKQCADVSKLMYHMRINGDLLDKDLLVAFDGQLQASLNGDLQPHRVPPFGVNHGRTISALPLPTLTSPSWQSTTRAPTQPSTLQPNAAQLLQGQLDEALAERELSWRNVLSGIEGAMSRIWPLLPSGTEARRATPGPETLEDPLAWTRACTWPCFRCTSRKAPERPARDNRNLGVQKSITRGCGS